MYRCKATNASLFSPFPTGQKQASFSPEAVKKTIQGAEAVSEPVSPAEIHLNVVHFAAQQKQLDPQSTAEKNQPEQHSV